MGLNNRIRLWFLNRNIEEWPLCVKRKGEKLNHLRGLSKPEGIQRQIALNGVGISDAVIEDKR